MFYEVCAFYLTFTLNGANIDREGADQRLCEPGEEKIVDIAREFLAEERIGGQLDREGDAGVDVRVASTLSWVRLDIGDSVCLIGWH